MNPTGFTQKLKKGSCVGHASEVEWITADGQVSGALSNQSNEGLGGEVMEAKTGGVDVKVVVVGESSESQEMQISGVGGKVVVVDESSESKEVQISGVGGKVVVVGESLESLEMQISGVGGEVVEVKTGGAGGKVVVVGESSIRIKSVCENAAERKKRLSEVLAEVGPSLQWQEKDKLWCLLLNNHHTFAVDEMDRGETDLV